MTRKKGITIGKTRGAMYRTSRILGDVNAVKNGRIVQRLWRRLLGKLTGRAIGKASR